MSNNTTVPLCTNDFPSTRQLFQELGDDVAVIVVSVLAVIVTLATIGIFLEAAWFLIRRLKNKSRRVKLICILALYPVVSSTSLHAVFVPRSTLIAEFAASIYLSFCIMLFVHLVIHYFGGDEHILRAYDGDVINFNTPPCCCCCLCLRGIPFNKCSLKAVKYLVLQVSVIRPIILFVAAVLWTDGYYVPAGEADPASPTLYINILNAVSTLSAIYGMTVTYRATAEKLHMYRLKLKFGSLQLAVVLLNLQKTVLAIIARFSIPPCSGTRDSRVRASRFHHFLLVLEMFLLALLARFSYRRKETEMLDLQEKPEKENGEIASRDDYTVDKSNIVVENDQKTEQCNIADTQTYL